MEAGSGKGGRKKIFFLGDIFPNLWPPPPSVNLKDKKEEKNKVKNTLLTFLFLIFIAEIPLV